MLANPYLGFIRCKDLGSWNTLLGFVVSTVSVLFGCSFTNFFDSLACFIISSTCFFSSVVIVLFISCAVLPVNFLLIPSRASIAPLKVRPKPAPRVAEVVNSVGDNSSCSFISFCICLSATAVEAPCKAALLKPFAPFAVDPKGIICIKPADIASP